MSANVATGLAITNPLVKYRALVATKSISPDNGQLRLALHLQKLYDRLKDYEPELEYSERLDQISRAVKIEDGGLRKQRSAELPSGTWRNFMAAKEKRDSLALTRRLTSHETAMQLNSPKGLMLHGEVGTGKSMLIDLFADCLPNRKKRRWHFNTFMLEAFAKLESYRRTRSVRQVPPIAAEAEDYSLLWLAKDLIQTSPIIFLDEFQMPDRVASKILTNLMTSFFHLGGVLIATSNRMPEELAKASGIEFQPPPSRLESLGWQFGLRRRPGLHAGRNEFAAFLDVLKARCEVWEMEGGRDYRRIEHGGVAPLADTEKESQLLEEDGSLALDEGMLEQYPKAATDTPSQEAIIPAFYHISSAEEAGDRKSYESALQRATGEASVDRIELSASTMKVYGRTIPVPRSYKGVTEWKFDELCKTTLGPADYITLASTYHTLMLHNVPILTSLMKNEARRFITLLDALYECRCKLFITAEAGPDDLFFPEKITSSGDQTGDSIQSETFSEAYQDATAPFRPNILTENPYYSEPDSQPDYTHARLAGLLNADALEDDPPNKPSKERKPFGRSFGRVDAEIERKPVDPDNLRYTSRSPDFGKTAAFTGEDERFAYKRAQSRLWEICGSRWWARNEADWHRPLPLEVRRWERPVSEQSRSTTAGGVEAVRQDADVSIGESTLDETRDETMFRHSASPFRVSREPPPKFSWVHMWSLMTWGPRAGKWGQGVEALKDREKDKS